MGAHEYAFSLHPCNVRIPIWAENQMTIVDCNESNILEFGGVSHFRGQKRTFGGDPTAPMLSSIKCILAQPLCLVVSTMVMKLLTLLITACLFPTHFGFVVASRNLPFSSSSSSWNREQEACQKKRMKSIMTSDADADAAAVSDDETLFQKDDVRDFHHCASAAVDLSNAHVSESGVFTGKNNEHGTFLLAGESTVATLLEMHLAHQIQRSVRDWDSDKRLAYLYQVHLKQSDDMLQQPPVLLDDSIKIRLPSPSGKKILVVKKQSGDDPAKKQQQQQSLEIWDQGSLVRRITVQGQHGSIIHDPTGFGIASWHPDESCVLYVAERLSPQTKPFWEKDADDTSSSHPTKIPGGKHVLGQGTAEEWGEQYVGQSPLLDLYIFHVGTGRIGRILNVPGAEGNDTTMDGGVTLGQPVWHPSEPIVAYTGWDAGGLGKMPRRLGMVYCRNRPSAVYTSDVSMLLKELSKPKKADPDQNVQPGKGFDVMTPDFAYARSPQYYAAGNTGELLVLANPNAFVSHEGCMGLYKAMDGCVIECIVPVIDRPSKTGPKISGMGFPGLFLHQLPSNVSVGKNYLILSSTWGSTLRLIRINTDTKEIHGIHLPNDSESTTRSHSILCQTSSGDLLVLETASNQPATIWLIPQEDLIQQHDESSFLSTDNAKLLLEFPPIAASTYSPIEPRQADVQFDVQLVSLPTEDEDKTLPPTQALICLPKKKKKNCGLIVIPHGGPHSCSISAYVPGFAFLASHYALLFPNYRGSTGFGQAAVESLLTHIGTKDVQDVMAMTKHAVKTYDLDQSKIGICGGSHGGFLTAHCIGQYPNFFKAAAMRNPVTNIAYMVTTTDIPDWCHAEALGSYNFESYRGPNAEELSTMFAKSPISFISSVKTPTLIALGMKDLRVPPSQGMEYYHSLRSSAQVETKLLVYPEDNHALNRVATEADHWIHIKQWFDQYL
eukprot:scaffold7641_cov115-Cylindrotheca_fusiformis.AAC.10